MYTLADLQTQANVLISLAKPPVEAAAVKAALIRNRITLEMAEEIQLQIVEEDPGQQEFRIAFLSLAHKARCLAKMQGDTTKASAAMALGRKCLDMACKWSYLPM